MRWFLVAAACGLAYLMYDFYRYQVKLNPHSRNQTPAEIAEASDAFVRRLPVYGTTQ